MAQFGQTCVVGQVVNPEPPASQERGNEGGNETTDVDENIEDLEPGVALTLSKTESFFALFGSLGFQVVVHLPHNGLQVTLEKPVTKSDEQQRKASEGEQPADVVGCRHDGDRNQDVPQRHNG